MTDSERYRSVTDGDVERAVRGLPRREPGETLRRRVLSAAATARPQRRPWLRPALAAAVLVLLLMADIAVVSIQDRQRLLVKPRPAVPLEARKAGLDGRLEWLEQLTNMDGGLTRVVVPSRPAAVQHTRQALLKLLLENGDRG